MPTMACRFCGDPVFIAVPHHCRLLASSPPPPVPEVDVEAVVRRHSVAVRQVIRNRDDGIISEHKEAASITDIIRAAVQAGLDARGAEVEQLKEQTTWALNRVAEVVNERNSARAEVERLGEQLRLANIDALNESATNAHLQERVGLLELGDKALQDRLAALEDLELSVETLELNESKRADAAEAECTRLRERVKELEGARYAGPLGPTVREWDQMHERIAALEGALRKYGRHESGCHTAGVPRKRTAQDCGPPPPPRPGPCTCGLDTALSPGLPGKGEP